MPPLIAQRWHSVPKGIAGEAGDPRLERELGWSEGTIALLRWCFTRGMTRSDGLEADALPESVKCAARVFRRGIDCRDSGTKGSRDERDEAGAYRIDVIPGGGAGAKLPDPVLDTLRSDRFVVLDGRVASLWTSRLALQPGCLLSLDEHSKTLDSVADVLRAWRAAGAQKNWTIVGGGLLTDVAAFAADLVGIRPTFVPTTLLAMADACVGGKTGVNFPPWGKNQVGTFAFPERVVVWTGWLSTLPERELHAGGAECLKHALLTGDRTLFDELGSALHARSTEKLAELLPRVIRIKVDVVNEDPLETGKRAILNFGHTLGHALESLSQARTTGAATLLHGEAVALGMAYAAIASEKFGGLSKSDSNVIWRGIGASRCLMRSGDLARALGAKMLMAGDLWPELFNLMTGDKKNLSGKGARGDATSKRPKEVSLVLLSGFGQIAKSTDGGWTIPVGESDLAAAWLEFVARLPA